MTNRTYAKLAISKAKLLFTIALVGTLSACGGKMKSKNSSALQSGADQSDAAHFTALSSVSSSQSQISFAGGQLTLNSNSEAVSISGLNLVMQPDGNLVIYLSNGQAVWATSTSSSCASGNCSAVFQVDGNFVLYNGSTPFWASNTSGHNGATLNLSNQSPFLKIIGPASEALYSATPFASAPVTAPAPAPVPAPTAPTSLNQQIALSSMTKTVGGDNGDGTWNLWSEGYVETNSVAFPSAGTYTIAVDAYGSVCQGGWPKMEIRIDGATKGSVDVSSASLAKYSVDIAVAAGNHKIEAAFINDCYSAPEDRNLYVKDILVSGPTASAPSPAPAPAPAPAPVAPSSLNQQFAIASMTKSTGGDSGDGSWNIWSEGYVETPAMTFPSSGTYQISVDAYGSICQGVWPQMEIRVDGAAMSVLTVPSASVVRYSVNVAVTAGSHKVEAAFLNDCYAPPEDRNLYVKQILVSGPGAAVTPAPAPAPAPVATPVPAPAPAPVAGSVNGAAYYISLGGNDSGSGSSSSPFRTLARAQQAARNSSTKTIVIRGGNYGVSATVDMTAADSGEAWIGFPGESAILDGGSGIVMNIHDGANNITIENLTIQNVSKGIAITAASTETIRWNTFLNCSQNCVSVNYYSDHVFVDSNSFNGGGGNGTALGAVTMAFHTTSSTVSHNLIQNFAGPGIAFEAGTGAQEVSNYNVIDRNRVINTVTGSDDSGAIYIMDRSHLAVGYQVTNNIIDTVGNGSLNTALHGIYLDDQTSNVLVSGNSCRLCGQQAIQIHGGDHNTFVNNVFDLSSGAKIGLYQDDPEFGTYGMGSNVFQRNILYFANGAANPLWDNVMSAGGSSSPLVSNNLYYSAAGASIPNGGAITDSQPKYGNPQFANAAGGNYSMAGSSAAYSQISFTALVTDQGPITRPSALPQ
jgi:hypothetical protein